MWAGWIVISGNSRGSQLARYVCKTWESSLTIIPFPVPFEKYSNLLAGLPKTRRVSVVLSTRTSTIRKHQSAIMFLKQRLRIKLGGAKDTRSNTPPPPLCSILSSFLWTRWANFSRSDSYWERRLWRSFRGIIYEINCRDFFLRATCLSSVTSPTINRSLFFLSGCRRKVLFYYSLDLVFVCFFN